jgi:putative phosphoesterase
MKIIFISDIHGVPSTLEKVLESAQRLNYDKIALLGDLMYHGPRNGIPDFYDPPKVASILNSLKDKIIAVRGNCDAEVDQMMLDFPIGDDYKTIEADGVKLFLTHGHLYNESKLPPSGTGDVLVHGHTHVPELKRLDCGITIFNPGSISLPKGGSSRSFGLFDNGVFSHICI